MHAQRGHATCLAGRGAHYLLTVKRNQPGLFAQLAALPWRQVPVAHQSRERGHGRDERQLANRLVGVLHGCLKTRTLYDEGTAWPQQNNRQFPLRRPGTRRWLAARPGWP